MSITEFCQWLYDTPLANMVRESESLFPWAESVHVLAIAAVVGSISFVDLRLLGLASRDRPVSQLVNEVLPITWIAFVIALGSGVMLFASNALEYYNNPSFRIKMVLLMLAGMNMLVFHGLTYRGVGQWDLAPRPPLGAKIAGGTSLLLWIGVVAFGRWIGFTTGF
jgi:hypothetical protein